MNGNDCKHDGREVYKLLTETSTPTAAMNSTLLGMCAKLNMLDTGAQGGLDVALADGFKIHETLGLTVCFVDFVDLELRSWYFVGADIMHLAAEANSRVDPRDAAMMLEAGQRVVGRPNRLMAERLRLLCERRSHRSWVSSRRKEMCFLKRKV